MAYNICYTTLVTDEMPVNDDLCNICDFDQEEPASGKPVRQKESEQSSDEETSSDEEEAVNAKTITKHYTHKFVKKEVRNGILPQLVRKLVEERNIIKAKMVVIEKEIKRLRLDPLTKDQIANLELQLIILDKRQNALKVAANSIYGFLGAQNGFLPFIEGARSTTAWGRSLIEQVNVYTRTKYNGVVVYGDTDSSMVDLHIKDSRECYGWGIRLAEEISGRPEKILPDGALIPAIKGLFPAPLRVEFEKWMRIFCIKKKKYAYYEGDKQGNFKKDTATGLNIIKKKGIAIARRDNCNYFKQTYVQLLQNVMDHGNMKQGLDIIVKACTKLLRNDFPAKGNLTVIRGLGANYKSASYFMKVFADELRRIGKPANPGDRIEYVITRSPAEDQGEEIPLGKKMRMIEMFHESEAETIDSMYYIEHMFQNALDQLFSIGYNRQLVDYSNIGFVPKNRRRKPVSIQTPVAMISKMINEMIEENQQYRVSNRAKLALIADEVAKIKI